MEEEQGGCLAIPVRLQSLPWPMSRAPQEPTTNFAPQPLLRAARARPQSTGREPELRREGRRTMSSPAARAAAPRPRRRRARSAESLAAAAPGWPARALRPGLGRRASACAAARGGTPARAPGRCSGAAALRHWQRRWQVRQSACKRAFLTGNSGSRPGSTASSSSSGSTATAAAAAAAAEAAAEAASAAPAGGSKRHHRAFSLLEGLAAAHRQPPWRQLSSS